MDYITAINNYVVLTPEGKLLGFKDKDRCVNYVTGYEFSNMLDFKHNKNDGYFDFYVEQDQKDFGTITGVNKGDCLIYNIDDVIENIQNADIFQSEKDEIISELLKEDINLNIYDIGIDDIIISLDALWKY